MRLNCGLHKVFGCLGYGLNTGITVTYASVPYLLAHGVFVFLGYVCFVKALEQFAVFRFGIGVLESIYYVLETFSFVNDAPTVVMIIEQMRIFLVFVLSVIFKMDKFTLKKMIALVLGVISVIGVYYS